MAEWSGFFDAHKLGDTWDRVYLAEHFASYFSPLIGKGVFAGQSNELQVFQDSPASMSVTVSSGRAWIEGYGYSNTSDLILSVDPADGALGRLDRVVIQWSSQDRQIKAIWKKGTPAVSPVLPELRWDADYKELNLAILNISAGLSAITQAQIQDTRADTTVCGWVTGLVDQVDTSTLFEQWESAYQQYFEAQKTSWETFFESIQQDIGVPVPSVGTKNQILVVNPQGDGYELTDTPIVGTPVEDMQTANKQYVDTQVTIAKKYADSATSKASPYNLLDNSDFRNPVNQRGTSSYNTAHAYCIDRWKLNDYAGTGTLAVTASGVKLTSASGVAEISQKLERSASFTGKNMTFAVKILGASSPNILNVTFGTNHSSVEANGCTLIHWSNDFLIRVSSEKTIEWAALYEGTYTADTLPEYHPKGYAAEFAECQRYFYQTSGELVLSGYITGSAKRLYVGIHLPEMRISPSLANPVPTMTIRTTAGYSPVANNTSPFGTPTAQAIAAFNRAGGDASMYFEFSDEIGSNNTPAVAQFRGNSYLAFSADL